MQSINQSIYVIHALLIARRGTKVACRGQYQIDIFITMLDCRTLLSMIIIIKDPSLPCLLPGPRDGAAVHAMHLFETQDAMHWNAA